MTVRGEALISRKRFEEINAKIVNVDDKYKNARNLASGTVKNLDTKIVRNRHIKFVCWNANDLSIDGTMKNGLDNAEELGFSIVNYYIPINNLNESVPTIINNLKNNL